MSPRDKTPGASVWPVPLGPAEITSPSLSLPSALNTTENTGSAVQCRAFRTGSLVVKGLWLEVRQSFYEFQFNHLLALEPEKVT